MSFLENFAQTQGLCTQTTGTERGAFSVSSSAICSGQTVTITDASGGSNVSYYFGYEGTETQAQLTAGATTATTSTPLLAGTLQVYTILQIGKKNGKDMYACQNITVRPDNKPLFSYSICNNTVEIVIPINPLNNFDKYEILTTGNSSIVIDKSDLPYEKELPIILPSTLTFDATYQNIANGCGNFQARIPLTINSSSNSPHIVNINQIELETSKIAKIDFSGSLSNKGYDLYAFKYNESYPSTPIKIGIQPGTHSIQIQDSTQSFCFFLQRPLSCGSQERSIDLCTNPIIKVSQDANKTNTIEWVNHKKNFFDINNLLPSIGSRNNISSLEISYSDNNGNQDIFFINNETKYINSYDCKKKVCYKYKTVSSGMFANNIFSGTSISNEICVDRKTFHPPAITDAFVTVTNTQKNSISFQDNSGWALNKEVFRINRSDQPNAPFNAIDSTTTNNDTRIDASAMPETASYCYQIDYRDECGSTSEPSPTFCNLHLTEQNNGGIEWTNESPFADSPLTACEVLRYDEVTNAATSEVIFSPPTTYLYLPDYTHFQDYATFRVKGTNTTGKESWSNLIKIPLEPKLFLPTAFSPNNDGNNDDLALQGNFGRITSFSFTIVNRWGETIFTSENVNQKWDGTIQAKPAPEGYYYYRIKATTNTNEIINKKGQIVLLR